MIPSAKTRAHRKLRGISQFKFCESVDALPQLAGHDTPLGDAEELLGAYENIPNAKENLLLVTDRGLHWWSEASWQSLQYCDILEIEWPSKVKMEARELPIKARSGRSLRVPVHGGTEFTRDLFGVWTFLLRMLEDERRRQLEASPITLG